MSNTKKTNYFPALRMDLWRPLFTICAKTNIIKRFAPSQQRLSLNNLYIYIYIYIYIYVCVCVYL